MPRCAAAAASAACPTSHSSKSGSAGVSGLLGVGAGLVEHRRLSRRRQDRALGERVRLPATEEHQRRLAVLDPRVVGLHQHRAALGLQRRGVGARLRGSANRQCANGSRTDGRLDHDLTAGQRALVSPGAKNRLGTVGDARVGEVGQVALVGVPRHHLGRVEQIGHARRPGQELVEPVDVVPRRAQDHQVGVERSPGRPRTASGRAGRARAAPRPGRRRRRRPRGSAGQPASTMRGWKTSGRASFTTLE